MKSAVVINRTILLSALCLASPLLAQDPAQVQPPGLHDHEIVINSASQLVPWCRTEAEAHFIGQGASVYQWTASYHDRGKVLHVNGKLRVDGKDVAVSCRIARGARERYATIEFNHTP
jgi:hypothetical protein